ncbi:MAG: COX15/CtaA family protein [Acidobacteriota bacterium]|nr:COX15/CtaA family protein [Acidobacteriota bacterium]
MGGLVTSWEAGLAVVDWPNSFGYNMFLYPLSRMTGGIYYEHAHRLFGSLVGLTTLVLAFRFFRDERGRRWRWLALAALVMVAVQGLLGGLRVTGKLTLTTDPSQVSPSLTLAMVHGVFGQLFLSVLAALAAFTSTAWSRATPTPHPSARLDQRLSAGLAVVVVIQLMLGALVRHVESQQMDAGIVTHVSLAGLVAVAALIAGLRAWGAHREIPILRRLGAWLLWIMPLQLLLGLGALVAVLFRGGRGEPSWTEVLVATAHQLNGALLLGLCVLLACWTRRLLRTPA